MTTVTATRDSTQDIEKQIDDNTIYNTAGGIYKGNTLLANRGDSFNLFDFKWIDYLLNDQSWLRADTFSWQDGTVYQNAYNHLVDDVDGITPTTEIAGSYTITYYPASDGHKIVMPDQEAVVSNIYNESGVAWYYILDTANQRFKLPRTKYGFTGLRDTVGKYVPESLPNIKGQYWYISGGNQTSGAFYNDTTHSSNTAYNNSINGTLGFDASLSSSTYKDNAPVQQRATQMYLYFYVGQFSQSATEQTAGLNAELFNGKLDLNAANLSTAGKSLISGLGMPSDRYIDLTLGATNSAYTAPANGYVCFSRQLTSNSYTWHILGVLKEGETTVLNENVEYRTGANSTSNSGNLEAFLPVKSGRTFYVAYGGGSTNLIMFRFIYAEGEPNV